MILNIRCILKYIRLVFLLPVWVFTIQPDPSLKVRNAAQAVDMVLSFLRQQTSNIPDKDIKWQEQTIHATGKQDYEITSKLFSSDDWMIEVYQGVAPLKRTIYQVTVFNSGDKYFWKGSIKPDGTITETNANTQLSEEESSKIANELDRKARIPPRLPGGYGH